MPKSGDCPPKMGTFDRLSMMTSFAPALFSFKSCQQMMVLYNLSQIPLDQLLAVSNQGSFSKDQCFRKTEMNKIFKNTFQLFFSIWESYRIGANDVIISPRSKLGPQWRKKRPLWTNQLRELFACPSEINPLGISSSLFVP